LSENPGKPLRLSRIGVVGAGTMGAGIAQLGCLAGVATVLHDPDAQALDSGAEKLRAALEKGAERGRWSAEEADAASSRLTAAPGLEGLEGCELVVEAAPEKLELKRELFARLAEICGDHAILATNTSSLSVTAIAAGVPHPQRVCGMHFFNPPPLMRLVEVVAGDESSEETLREVSALATAMDREPVRAADAIGFIANRANRPFSLESLRLLGEGVSDVEQIDRIVRIGGGYRMGPFELQDLIGVDVNLAVARSFYEQSFGEPRWRPSPLQVKLVDSGRHGRKSGRGWYGYELGPHRADDPPGDTPAAPEAPTGDFDGDGFSAVDMLAGGMPSGAQVGYAAVPDVATARLVEIVRGPQTGGAELTSAGRHFAGLGKHVECVYSAAPGLVLGRIVCQLVNEAHFALGEGVAEAADIDTAVRLGLNHPRGPFEWCEAIGAERVVATLDALRGFFGEERYRVAPSLRSRAAANRGGSENS
jgi:3-hydroxybutyryl-CoA dehydrogenase